MSKTDSRGLKNAILHGCFVVTKLHKPYKAVNQGTLIKLSYTRNWYNSRAEDSLYSSQNNACNRKHFTDDNSGTQFHRL